MSLLPPVGKPSVEVPGWPGREIHQQLHEIEMRVHVMAATAAGALEQAIERRQPEPGLVHHSDRGFQYAHAEYIAMIAE